MVDTEKQTDDLCNGIVIEGVYKGRKVIDPRSLKLDQWLIFMNDSALGDRYVFDFFRFPNDEIHDNYLATASERSDDEIRGLLRRFLLPSTNLGYDSVLLENAIHSQNIIEKVERWELYRRLFNPKEMTWEGLTWVIDLLPYWPTQAIQAISAYILAHAQQLPDGRLSGLGDCIDLISAKYLDKSDPKESLTNLTDRHFEVVIASLYKKIGYEVVLTKKSRDGGFDVSAQRAMGRGQEHLLVECKKYSGAVGVQVVRQLLGVISASKVTKGVIVTTSRFTKPALQFADEHKRKEFASTFCLFCYVGINEKKCVLWLAIGGTKMKIS